MMKLAQAMRRMRKDEKGFTLIELMVVIVIIGILAAIAIPQFAQIINHSRQQSDVATGKTFKDALDRYYTDYGNYTNLTTSDSISLWNSLYNAKYINNPPKFAQNGGGADPTTFDKIFVVNFGSNNNATVEVHNAGDNTLLWSSAS